MLGTLTDTKRDPNQAFKTTHRSQGLAGCADTAWIISCNPNSTVSLHCRAFCVPENSRSCSLGQVHLVVVVPAIDTIYMFLLCLAKPADHADKPLAAKTALDTSVV
jgi:hypothetical protein